MEMNDILNGLNSCDDDCCDSMSDNCSCGPNFGGSGMGCFPGGFGQGAAGGCGFGSWIWILLILFYCGCGKGNYGRGSNECCCHEKKDDCCCNKGNYGGGILGNCSSYLFLLVILFLCNSGGKSGFGGGCGLGGFGGGSPIGCGTCC